MGRKRNNIVKGDFGKQLDFFDHMLDCVTLGTKEIAVEQAGSWPPYAMVVSSRVWPRDPRTQLERLQRMERAMLKHLSIYDDHPGEKYCLACGEWRTHSRYSPDARHRDGLQSWCRYCRAEHARKMYWHEKNTAILRAA